MKSIVPLRQRWALVPAFSLLDGRQGLVITATDYVRAFADQIRAFAPATGR